MGNSKSTEITQLTTMTIQGALRRTTTNENPVVRAAKVEDLFFDGELPGEKPPPDVIVFTRFLIDGDGDVQILFHTTCVRHYGTNCDGCGAKDFEGGRHKCQTCFDYDLCDSCQRSGTVSKTHKRNHAVSLIPVQTKYGVVIRLRDRARLGWKECQALGCAMKIAARGTPMQRPMMQDCQQKMAQKFGEATLSSTPSSGRLVLTVNPGPGNCKDLENTIRTVRMNMDANGDLDVVGTTEKTRFSFHMVLVHRRDASGGVSLTMKECEAMSDLFSMCETGDRMDQDVFLAYGAVLQLKYNKVSVSETAGSFSCRLSPTPVERTEPIEPRLLEAVARQKQRMDNAGGTQRRSAAAPGAAAAGGGGGGGGGGDLSIPGFSMRSKIVESGQATVYRGTYKGKDVAVKVFTATDDSDDYKSEVRSLLKTGDHPNVMSIIDFFETPRPCIIMRFVEGGNLMEFLKKRGGSRMSDTEALHIIGGIAEGVGYLHQSGFVHRDLKSPNILMENGKTPVIIDLGLGVKWGTRDSTMVTVAPKGTMLWMAPEMMSAATYSDKTDVYAFGIIIWEVLSCKMPYYNLPQGLGPLVAAVMAGTRPLVNDCGSRPQNVVSVMTACWDKDPHSRPTMTMAREQLTSPSGAAADPRSLFRRHDAEHNGRLTFASFTMLLSSLGFAGKVSPTQQAVLFQSIDTDRSNTIEEPEFMEWWRVVERRGADAALAMGDRQKRMY